ncbi:MAG: SMI1/KNR4 family protein [Myxococcota bacterium]|nr:SMI1/KNR4 family protein [Myxococcota bacterium]
MSSDAAFAKIAKTTGFEVPELFRRMVADGVTTYGTSPAAWKKTWKKRSLTNPPALLMAGIHVEWLKPKDIAAHEREEHWKPKLTLVPFAQNGGGDLWCFYPGAKKADPTPIALCPMDSDEAELYAPDLEGFLFRQLLNAFAEIDPKDGEFTPAQTVQMAKAEIKTITPYVRKGWIDVLDEVASRRMKTDKNGYRSFIGFKEAKALARKTLGYKQLDATFVYAA